ncbi:MAG: 50S ribosomal protein L16 [Candidatus Aenigmatarchaeota archaeon]
MTLRPGRTTRKIERPYTRQSRRTPRKSYVVGVPFPKLHQFEMGSKGDYDTTLWGVAKMHIQIRENALEASRIVATKFLESTLGTNFFMKILVFPHHVIREHAIAQGAGADRFSQGMRRNFGRPQTTAVQIRKDQRIFMLKVNKSNLETAKRALKKASLKLPTPLKVVIQ